MVLPIFDSKSVVWLFFLFGCWTLPKERIISSFQIQNIEVTSTLQSLIRASRPKCSATPKVNVVAIVTFQTLF